MAFDTEENRQQQLSFPQRYWFLLCVVAAIVSPIIVGWLQTAAHQRSYKEATEQRPSGAGSGSSSESTPGGASGTSTPSASPAASTPGGSPAASTPGGSPAAAAPDSAK